MMRYAAEHGFDRIAWTTGEQQADRYDLSKQVDKVLVSKYKDGYTLKVLLPGRAYNNDQTLIGEKLTESQLEEQIGKDLTQKVILDNLPLGQTNVYEGNDLKVGGTGMKAFYDKIIPSAASKLGKPFGAKLEPVEIDINVGLGIEDANESILSIPGNGIIEVQSIPVTETMKETAMNGVPLFSVKGSKTVERVDDVETVRKAIQDLQDKAVNAKPLFMYSSEKEFKEQLASARIPEEAAKKVLSDGKTIGFYDEGRGIVFIDLRKIGSVQDGISTWVHEMGLHAGLRNIIPAEQFDRFMEEVYDLFEKNNKTFNAKTADKSSQAAKKAWDAVMESKSYNNVNKAKRGEEMMAYFGERYSKSVGRGDTNLEDKGIFRQIVEKITNLLRKVFGLTPKQLTLEDVELIVKGSIRSMFATGTRPVDAINQEQGEGKVRPDGKVEYEFTPLERKGHKQGS